MRRARAIYRNPILKARTILVHVESPVSETVEIVLPGRNVPFLDRGVDLWSDEASKQFERTFGGSNVQQCLDGIMRNVTEPLRLLVTADSGSSVPWEAFQRNLARVHRRHFAPLRMVGPESSYAYSSVPDRMRVLVLIGHPGDDRSFDPSVAEQLILDAILRPGTVKSTFLEENAVKAIQLRDDTLPDAANVAAEIRPNVVVFFGNGRRSGAPSLCLGPGESGWHRVSEIAAQLFPLPLAPPPFWIFWACSLAEDTAQPRVLFEGPDVMNALGRPGAISVLAMRSRLSARPAKVMLEALMQAFVAGEPLEVAAAHARDAALTVAIENTDRMDFAAPAVWSLSQPVDRLDWGGNRAFPASWVVQSLLGNVDRQPDLATGVAPIAPYDRAAAQSWASPGYVFATTMTAAAAPPDPLLVQARFFAIGAAFRQTTGRPVIPIFLSEGADFDGRLRNWAAVALARLDPRWGDGMIVAAIVAVQRGGCLGLPRLLSIPDAVVMISEPPERNHEWQALGERTPTTTVVVIGSVVPEEAIEWRLDQLIRADLELEGTLAQLLTRAIEDVPETLAFYAVVQRPASLQDVSRATGITLDRTSIVAPLLVQVGSRRVLGQVARLEVMERLDSDTLVEARKQCIAFLTNEDRSVSFSAAVEVAVQHHALNQPHEASIALNAAFRASGSRWTQGELYQIFRMILDAPNELRGGLEVGLLIAVAGAGVMAKQTRSAGALLDSIQARLPADRARIHALKSEVFKSDVAGANAVRDMLRQARLALNAAREASATVQDPLKRLLATAPYEQNLARISQYFHHQYDEAWSAYLALMERLTPTATTDLEAGDIFAAASRNAAECLLDPAPRPLTPAQREEIDGLLERGLRVATEHKLWSTRAELLYTQARTSEAAGDPVSALRVLGSIFNAQEAYEFPVVSTIARDRHAWLSIRVGRQPFDFQELRARLRQLDSVRAHAWAVRVAIKSRIRGAKALWQSRLPADMEAGRALLVEAQTLFNESPGLHGQGDLQLDTEVRAGLQVLAADSPTPALNVPPADPAVLIGERPAHDIWNSTI
jgi:hypothetical protein